MHKIDLQVGKDIYKINKEIANKIRELLDEKGVKAIDFMGSIGSGKTLIIERLIELLKNEK